MMILYRLLQPKGIEEHQLLWWLFLVFVSNFSFFFFFSFVILCMCVCVWMGENSFLLRRMRCKRGLTSPFGPSAKRENAAPWCARATPNDNGLIIRLRAPSLVFWPLNGIHKKAKKKKKKKKGNKSCRQTTTTSATQLTRVCSIWFFFSSVSFHFIF